MLYLQVRQHHHNQVFYLQSSQDQINLIHLFHASLQLFNLRSNESLKLLNWGFRNTNTFEVSNREKSTFELDTWLANKDKIKAVSKEDYYITINKKNVRNLQVSLKYNGPIVAPVDKGEKIAELVISNKSEIIKTLPLYAAEDLKKVNFFKSLITSINYLIWGDV